MPTTPRIAVIGGGPAGLKACESAAKNGAEVTLFDAKPSVGRKFLIAGKSGLNLTNDEDFQPFLSRYTGDNFPVKLWHEILSEFDKEASKEWAQSLGISTFTSSGNKVFPEQMKAAPLLRRWTTSLKSLGVTFHMRHKLSSIRFTEHSVVIAFEDEDTEYEFDHLILALGGASWPSSGSDGKWVEILAELGIGIIPLSSANCGWHIEWNHKFFTYSRSQTHIQSRATHCQNGIR